MDMEGMLLHAFIFSMHAFSLQSTHCRYNFPSRAAACQAVLELVSAHPEKAILIGIDKLGKGSFFTAIRSCFLYLPPLPPSPAAVSPSKIVLWAVGIQCLLPPCRDLLAAVAAPAGERMRDPAKRWARQCVMGLSILLHSACCHREELPHALYLVPCRGASGCCGGGNWRARLRARRALGPAGHAGPAHSAPVHHRHRGCAHPCSAASLGEPFHSPQQ